MYCEHAMLPIATCSHPNAQAGLTTSSMSEWILIRWFHDVIEKYLKKKAAKLNKGMKKFCPYI
jgi:hypothetical protein